MDLTTTHRLLDTNSRVHAPLNLSSAQGDLKSYEKPLAFFSKPHQMKYIELTSEITYFKKDSSCPSSSYISKSLCLSSSAIRSLLILFFSSASLTRSLAKLFFFLPESLMVTFSAEINPVFITGMLYNLHRATSFNGDRGSV